MQPVTWLMQVQVDSGKRNEGGKGVYILVPLPGLDPHPIPTLICAPFFLLPTMFHPHISPSQLPCWLTSMVDSHPGPGDSYINVPPFHLNLRPFPAFRCWGHIYPTHGTWCFQQLMLCICEHPSPCDEPGKSLEYCRGDACYYPSCELATTPTCIICHWLMMVGYWFTAVTIHFLCWHCRADWYVANCNISEGTCTTNLLFLALQGQNIDK